MGLTLRPTINDTGAAAARTNAAISKQVSQARPGRHADRDTRRQLTHSARAPPGINAQSRVLAPPHHRFHFRVRDRNQSLHGNDCNVEAGTPGAAIPAQTQRGSPRATRRVQPPNVVAATGPHPLTTLSTCFRLLWKQEASSDLPLRRCTSLPLLPSKEGSTDSERAILCTAAHPFSHHMKTKYQLIQLVVISFS